MVDEFAQWMMIINPYAYCVNILNNAMQFCTSIVNNCDVCVNNFQEILRLMRITFKLFIIYYRIKIPL